MAEPQKTDLPENQTRAAQKTGRAAKVVFIITIVVCALLVPVLIINSIMIVKTITNPDKVPDIFGYAPMLITDDNMEPDITDGDIIFAKVVDPAEIEEGNIILFFDTNSHNQGKVLIQRVTVVVEEDGKLIGWQTEKLGTPVQGDNNTTFTVPTKNLVGRWDGDRVPALAKAAVFIQSVPGMIICVVVPVTLLIGYELLRGRSETKKAKKNTAALMAELEALRALQNQTQATAPDQTQPSEQPTDGEGESPENNDP